MILRQSRAILQITCCCQGHIHTTPHQPAPRDPKKQWEEFSENLRKKGNVRSWMKDMAQKQQERGNEFQANFEKARQEYREKREEKYKGGSSQGGVEGDLPGKFLGYFPTTAKFNSIFDRALGKLPSGGDIVGTFPPKYWPYLQLSRVDKPIGSWLLFLPGAWGICMAPGVPNIPLIGLFGLGMCYQSHSSINIRFYCSILTVLR